MIGIVDYGVGNVAAFRTIYKRLNVPCVTLTKERDFSGVNGLVLPGVGSFDSTMRQLNCSGMRDALDRCVTKDQLPLMAICVGMQILGESSGEGESKGLGYIPGKIKLIDPPELSGEIRLPHMGWNNVAPMSDDPIWQGIDEKLGFYFLHSYYFDPARESSIFARVQYGSWIPCAVRNDNIYGFQFHPEKSLSNGVQLLKNFSTIVEC